MENISEMEYIMTDFPAFLHNGRYGKMFDAEMT